MDNGNSAPDSVGTVTVAKAGSLEKIFKIFYEPSAVFPALTKKIDWLIPLIIISIIGGTLGFYVRPLLALEQEKGIMKNIEKYRESLTTERYNEIVDNIQSKFAEAKENKFAWYYPFAIIGVIFLFLVIISGVGILTGNFILGGRANFWIVMNAIAYAALVGLLGDVVRNSLMLLKGTAGIYTGLGLLKSMVGSDGFMFYLFRQIDLFTIWRIVVTCIGLGAVYKMKPKKFGYVLFPVWIVLIVLIAVANTFVGGTIIY